MTKRIQPTEPTNLRIRTPADGERRIEPRVVAEALGGEPVAGRAAERPAPLTLYALRQELLGRRQSSGGRPGIEGADLRAKIPLPRRDWERLEVLAESLTIEGFSPSAGQIASVLLSMALRWIGKEPLSPGRAAALAAEIAARGKPEKPARPAR
jgi:hypothetical protein